MADFVYTPTERSRARARRRELTQDAPLVARLDWVMLAAVAGIVLYGLWGIDGITRNDVPGSPNYYLYRQVAFVVVGLIGLVLAILIDPEIYRRFKRQFYVGTLLLFAFVFMAGTVARGSKRWIDLGFFRFQPSEFGKLLIVLALAGFLADRYRRMNELRTSLTAIALALPPMLLVFIQPDIGSALVYAAALVGVLLIAGVRWLHLTIFAVIAVVLAMSVLWWLPSAGTPVLKSYQTSRLTGFFHPDQDPRGSTYNVAQSITAVGSGGATGRGVAGATQTSLRFLPEHATDFVFASLAEQRGFFGAGVLLMLYLLVVWRGLKAVAGARDPYSAIVAGGIIFAFLFQIFVNVGMTIGIAPVTGIPLPMVSVGGSSMIANLLAIGVLQAVYVRGRGRTRIARW
ncbi:MAG TPA: rod shape-determining protein RodA [Gaiellaceae bacterium]|jgi:rod shape determining protein RodA|nr:rod shape-determining protein RodA [Gaiellaceae bacterium]